MQPADMQSGEGEVQPRHIITAEIDMSLMVSVGNGEFMANNRILQRRLDDAVDEVVNGGERNWIPFFGVRKNKKMKKSEDDEGGNTDLFQLSSSEDEEDRRNKHVGWVWRVIVMTNRGKRKTEERKRKEKKRERRKRRQ
jgi:hypothetical protein